MYWINLNITQNLDTGVTADSHCTGLGRVQGLGMMSLYIMPLNVYTTLGQGMEPETNRLHTHFPVPVPGRVHCV